MLLIARPHKDAEAESPARRRHGKVVLGNQGSALRQLSIDVGVVLGYFGSEWLDFCLLPDGFKMRTAASRT